MNARVAKNRDEAFQIENKMEGQAHGWVQWKGTEVCMDVHCVCGTLAHVDGEFCHSVKCESCGRVYHCNGHIELIQIQQEPEWGVLLAKAIDD